LKAFYPGFTYVYGDAEFTPDNHTPGGLVSLALHSEHHDIYLVNAEADREAFCASAFCRDHIWSKLPLRADGSLDRSNANVVPYRVIAGAVESYFRHLCDGEKYRNRIGFVADHGTQDMQRIHNLYGNDWFGRMSQCVPRRPLVDIATLEDLAQVQDGRLPDGTPMPVKSAEMAHHAMYDAMWDRRAHEFLMSRSRAVRVASGAELLAD
jgi:hypothetical protein